MKKISQEKLNKKIELHRLWLMGGDKGERLVLRGFDLRGLDLRVSNLENADLSYSNLMCTFLSHANLTWAYLEGTNLQYSDLRHSDLQYANLKNADLTYADLSYAYIEDCCMDGIILRDVNTNHLLGLDIYSVNNIGTFNGNATYIPDLDKVFAGCWEGSLEEFLEKGVERNKENEKETNNIKLAYEFFKNNKEVK